MNNKNTDEKILDRIRKLLSMAGESSSPHEAMIAAKRARLLMDKHQVSKDDLLTDKNDMFDVADGRIKPKQKPAWMLDLACSIAYLNDCQAIVRSKYREIIFQYRGFKSDAIIAKYMHDYLVDTCIRLLDKSGIEGKSNKNFYRLGFTHEIAKRIQSIVAERHIDLEASDGKSLIILKKELVDSHFEKLKTAAAPKMRTPTLAELRAARKGADDASNVSLDQQLENDENARIAVQ